MQYNIPTLHLSLITAKIIIMKTVLKKVCIKAFNLTKIYPT